MELVIVKILTTVVTVQYGTLTEGDLLRTNAEFAKHLVEDCKAAEYAPNAAPANEPVKARERKAK